MNQNIIAILFLCLGFTWSFVLLEHLKFLKQIIYREKLNRKRIYKPLKSPTNG